MLIYFSVKIYESVTKNDAEEGNYQSTTYNTLF